MPASWGLPTLHLWPEPPTSQPIHQQPTPHPEQHEAQALRPSPKTHTATQAVAQEVLGASWPLWPLEPSCHVPHCLLVPCCASLRPTFKMRPWDSVSREAPAGWRQPRGSVLRCPSPSRTLFQPRPGSATALDSLAWARSQEPPGFRGPHPKEVGLPAALFPWVLCRPEDVGPPDMASHAIFPVPWMPLRRGPWHLKWP